MASVDRPAGGSIQNGSGRLLISQNFSPGSVPNKHLQGALRTKRFSRTSVPAAVLAPHSGCSHHNHTRVRLACGRRNTWCERVATAPEGCRTAVRICKKGIQDGEKQGAESGDF